jgi:molecular chaperone DnaJ
VHVPVTFAEATLGAEVRVPTLDAPVTIRVKPGTQSGTVLRVAGRGVKNGALLVTLDVRVPTDPTDAQREAVEKLAAEFTDDPRAELAAFVNKSTEAGSTASGSTASGSTDGT